MLIPFHKLVTIAVRVFARPLIDYTKLYHKGDQKPKMKEFFLWFGKTKHGWDKKINSSYIKT